MRICLIALLAAGSVVNLRAQAPAASSGDAPSSANAAASSTTSAAPSGHEMDQRDRVYYPSDTERIKPLAHKLLANVWLDQKAIWTSPFHMNRHTAPLWLGFAGATAALIATDRRTSTVFENSRGQIVWGNNISKIGASYTVVPVVAGFYLAGVATNDAESRETGVLGAEALLDSLIVVEALKPIAGRQRPNSTGEKSQFFDNGRSFPSGHAIESWSVASLVAHEYSNKILVQIAAYGLASVVTLARFAAQQHYAGDLLAGGTMGWFIGRYVYDTHKEHAGHYHAWLHPRISPIVQPSSRSYGVGLAFGQ